MILSSVQILCLIWRSLRCTHGVSQRGTWRKLHLGVDAESGEMLGAVVALAEMMRRFPVLGY